MKDLKGTKTEANLLAAFAGESQARNKYTYFASQARKDGYEQIARTFEETAGNEMEHAKLWFKHVHGGAVPKTHENLKAAAEGEHGEWTEMYRLMALDAKAEGFDEIAAQFEGVAVIEKRHEERYLDLLANIENKLVFAKADKVVWICDNCGHTHECTNAPLSCPVCQHPQAYFQMLVKNY